MAEPNDDRAGLPTVPGTGSALATPLDRLEQYQTDARGAFSANTARALRSDSSTFTTWCIAAGVSSLPAAARDLAHFIDEQAETRKPATVRRCVSSVAHMHRGAGLPNPAAEQVVRMALRRMNRSKGTAQRQAHGLKRDLVDRMLAAAGPSLRDLRNRALLAVAYDSLCRRSELVALRGNEVAIASDGVGEVTIQRSKTDQEGKGDVRYLARDTADLVTAWRNEAGITDGALFRTVDRWGKVGGPLDPGDVARLFKGMALAAGLPPGTVAAISAHSSRVGAALDMAENGKIGLPAILQSGGWTSTKSVTRYTKAQEARRGGAAQLAAAQGRG